MKIKLCKKNFWAFKIIFILLLWSICIKSYAQELMLNSDNLYKEPLTQDIFDAVFSLRSNNNNIQGYSITKVEDSSLPDEYEIESSLYRGIVMINGNSFTGDNKEKAISDLNQLINEKNINPTHLVIRIKENQIASYILPPNCKGIRVNNQLRSYFISNNLNLATYSPDVNLGHAQEKFRNEMIEEGFQHCNFIIKWYADSPQAKEAIKIAKQESIQYANLLVKRENYDAALDVYNLFLKYFKDISARSDIMNEIGKVNLAVEQKTNNDNKINFDNLLKEGDLQVSNKFYEDALITYSKALELIDNEKVREKIKSTQILFNDEQKKNSELLKIKQNKLKEAKKVKIQIELDKIKNLLLEGNINEAKICMDEVQQLSPNNPLISVYKIMIDKKTKLLIEEENKEKSFQYLEAGKMLIKIGEFRDAIINLKTSMKLFPNSNDAESILEDLIINKNSKEYNLVYKYYEDLFIQRVIEQGGCSEHDAKVDFNKRLGFLRNDELFAVYDGLFDTPAGQSAILKAKQKNPEFLNKQTKKQTFNNGFDYSLIK